MTYASTASSSVPTVQPTENRLKLGVFAINGGAAFTNHPDRFVPTWENNLRIAQQADRLGIEKLVSASRWKPFHKDGHYSGDLFETFTWAAAVAAVTEHIEVVSTVHLATVHPIIAAKSAATVDLISGGRFGMNLVCGWYRAEMEMFGTAMPGHDDRYSLADEWVEIFNRLWSDPRSFDYEGTFYQLKGAIAQPRAPFPRPTLLNAGGSERGRAFAAKNCDIAFVVPQDPRPEAIRRQVEEYRRQARDIHGKEIEVWMSCYVVQRDTREQADAYVQDYVVNQGDAEGVDSFMANNVGNAETWPPEVLQHVRFAVAAGYGGYPLVGSAEDIAEKLSALSDAGVDGFLMSWLDYEGGLTAFSQSVLPQLEQAGLRAPGRQQF
jgi:FMNH2-dependent dimethyl sulfone monooxygenase